MRSKHVLLDALYGEIVLEDSLADLILRPAVQRLRDIRLSNIDSLSMPGIANISRYEHAIGAAYLSTRLAFINRVSQTESIIVHAAALLHDCAISAFGHLVEEALDYHQVQFNHENKLSTLLKGDSGLEIGGIDLQLYLGRESGIGLWGQKTFGTDSENHLNAITLAMTGKGRFGPCIAGTIDVDNLDNITRIAFHMGLEVDRRLPTKIASGIVGCDEINGLTFSTESVKSLEQWLALRRKVYTKLMLSRSDFAGKAMLIYSIATAYKRGFLGHEGHVWTLTDRELLTRLLECDDDDVVKAVKSWLLHDLWPVSDLVWMSGPAPRYAKIYEFSDVVTTVLGRPCFAYAISDKRTRLLQVRLQSGEVLQVGARPDRWLLGVASRKREMFQVQDNRRLQAAACEFFSAKSLGKAIEATAEPLPSFG